MRSRLLLISALVLLPACLFGGNRRPTANAPTTTTSLPGKAAVDLSIGDCFNGLVVGRSERATVGSVVPIGCSEPHDLEVIDAFEFHDDGPYPGETTVAHRAEQGCAERFSKRVGEDASLGNLSLWPTAVSWKDGDRTVLCAAYQLSGRLVGTIH